MERNASRKKHVGGTHYARRQKPKSIKKPPSSKYRGVTVTKLKNRNKWVAKIKINGKLTYIGTYETELEAHYAFEEALKNNPGATS